MSHTKQESQKSFNCWKFWVWVFFDCYVREIDVFERALRLLPMRKVFALHAWTNQSRQIAAFTVPWTLTPFGKRYMCSPFGSDIQRPNQKLPERQKVGVN